MLVADGNAWMIIQDNFGPVMSASIFSKSINYETQSDGKWPHDSLDQVS